MNAESLSGWRCLSLALAFALLAQGLPAGESDGRVHDLQLKSGGRLIGEVKSHQPDGEWVVASPDASGPIRLKPEAVQSFSLLSGGNPAENSPSATLVFLSGDRVPADIGAFDGSVFEVRVPWAGEARPVKWGSLQRVVFEESGVRRVFAGPLPDQKWKFTVGPERGSVRKDPMEIKKRTSKDGTWEVEAGALFGNGPGSASVDVNLPDQVAIAYDLEWTGLLSVSMGMFSDAFLPADQAKPDGPCVAEVAAKNKEVIPLREGIAIDLSQHSVMLRSHSPDQGQDTLGSGQFAQEFRNRTSTRVTVRIDRAGGMCAIWFGDRLLQKWTELGNLGGTGKGLSFWQSHGNGTVVIRRLVVRTWNGKLDEEAPSGEDGRDVLVAADGTRISGKLGALNNGQFALETGVGALDVALWDLRHLVRAKSKIEKSEQHKARGALVTLASGGGQFHLEGFRVESDGGLLVGRHAEMGELSLPAAEVESVEFRATKASKAPAPNPPGEP